MTATIRELLAPVKARAEAYRDHGTPGLHAPQDRAKLLAAVEGVLEAHDSTDALMNPGRHERVVKVCTGCGTDDGNWSLWPCATVRAVVAALESET